DRLVYTTTNGITGSYNTSTGILTLSDTATSAAYQAALRSVKYSNVGGAFPSTAARSVTFAIGSAVANGTNGHFYEFVSFSGTWTQAKNNSITRSYLGLQGYLATLTSAAENDFVRQKLTSDGWIGAQANPENSFPRTWSWVTGPETGTAFCSNPSSGVCGAVNGGFSNWASGEPNNAGGEGCGQIYFANSGRWNDLPCNATVLAGYLVEYGGTVTDPVVTLTDTRALQVRAKTSIAVTSSAASVNVFSNVTFTATFSPAASTGTAQFVVDGAPFGSPVTLSGGVAAISTSALPLGAHTVGVTYAGDAERQAATGTLASGVTITTIATGSGPCTAANQATVCTSGLCNTTTSTCAATNGTSCTAANQCVSNRCGSNGQCGTTQGGSCASGADCQSGACSPNANTCIPSGGCAVTADCAAGMQCNASLQCEIAPGIDASSGTVLYDATGADVVIDPSLSVVGAQNIVGATVTIGQGFVPAQDRLVYATVNGITGTYNQASGVLTLSGSATSEQYQAALRTVKYSNVAGAFPATALRTITFGVGSAVANGANGHFYEFVSYNGTWTQAKAHAATRTYLGLRGYLATLTNAAENDFVSQKLSSDGWIGAQSNPETGFPRTWFWVTGPESGTSFCSNTSSTICPPISGRYTNWASGEPNNYGTGEGCGQIYFANSGKWNDLPCNSGTLPGYVIEYGDTPGDPVLTLFDSKSLQVRARTAIAVSSSHASAALHVNVTFTATFSPSASTGAAQFVVDGADYGAPVTISGGVASISTSTLGLGAHTIGVTYAGDVERLSATGSLSGGLTVTTIPNGQGPCSSTTAADDCASGVCSANGTCGYRVNEGPCTPGSSTECQSGVCSVGGSCMPSTPGGCFVDGDCAAGGYCDRASNTCAPTLTAGSPIPSDGLHDGTCVAGLSAA
ncbi:MAG TPA: Ig-like domain repeat protein, partial [Archangium sp.]